MWILQIILSGISDIWLIAFAFYVPAPVSGSIEEYIYFIINAVAFSWQASVLAGIGYNTQGFLKQWWDAIGRWDMGLVNMIAQTASALLGMFPPMAYIVYQGKSLHLF